MSISAQIITHLEYKLSLLDHKRRLLCPEDPIRLRMHCIMCLMLVEDINEVIHHHGNVRINGGIKDVPQDSLCTEYIDFLVKHINACNTAPSCLL